MKANVPLVVVPSAMGGFMVFEAPYSVAASWADKKNPAPLAFGDREQLVRFVDRHFTDWVFHAEYHGGHA